MHCSSRPHGLPMNAITFVRHEVFDRPLVNFKTFRPSGYVFSSDYCSRLNACDVAGDQGYLRDGLALEARHGYSAATNLNVYSASSERRDPLAGKTADLSSSLTLHRGSLVQRDLADSDRAALAGLFIETSTVALCFAGEIMANRGTSWLLAARRMTTVDREISKSH